MMKKGRVQLQFLFLYLVSGPNAQIEQIYYCRGKKQ